MRLDKRGVIYKGECEGYLSNKAIFPDGSIDLIITSPPYADRRENSYGGIKPAKYVEWFQPISVQLFRILKPKGSFVLTKKAISTGCNFFLKLPKTSLIQRMSWIGSGNTRFATFFCRIPSSAAVRIAQWQQADRICFCRLTG